MTWMEIFDVLCAGLDDLPRFSDDEMEQLEWDWAIEDENSSVLWDTLSATDRDVEAAIRVFSRTRQWPQLSRQERNFLQWRLEEGRGGALVFDVASRVLQMPLPAAHEENFLEWFLIDYWHEAGVGQIHDRLTALIRGFRAAVPRRSPGS